MSTTGPAARKEHEVIRENVTYSRAASRMLREIAAQRFPGRSRMVGVTLEQLIREEYERMTTEARGEQRG